jgi:hypothetical protein
LIWSRQKRNYSTGQTYNCEVLVETVDYVMNEVRDVHADYAGAGLTVQSERAFRASQRVRGHAVVGPDVHTAETSNDQPHEHFVG